jgi:hypothetical protein
MNRNGLRGPRTASLIVLLLSSALCAQAVPVASAAPGPPDVARLTIHNNSKQDLAGLWHVRSDPHFGSGMDPRTLDFSGGRSIPPGSAFSMPIASTAYEYTAQICRNGTWRNMAPVSTSHETTEFWVDVNTHDEVYAVYPIQGGSKTVVMTDSHQSC